MNSSSKFLALSVAIVILNQLFPAPVQAKPALLEEAFSGGERLVQNLPLSVAWYASESDGVRCNATGLTAKGNRHLVAYFAAPEKFVNLEAGDSLTAEITFAVKATVNSVGTLRIALLNSAGQRLSQDDAGPASPLFSGYTGYGVFLNLNWKSALSLVRRSAGASEKLISSNDAYATTLLKQTGRGAELVSETLYTAILTLTRTARGVEISFALPSFEGYSTSVTDSTHPVTSFDTIVLYGAKSGMSGYTIKSVTIK